VRVNRKRAHCSHSVKKTWSDCINHAKISYVNKTAGMSRLSCKPSEPVCNRSESRVKWRKIQTQSFRAWATFSASKKDQNYSNVSVT